MSPRILIVEDEVVVANNLRDRVRGLGYEVAGVAFTGEEAIQQAADTRPDLVLMDIKLPGEMDGLEAAEEICADSDVPVIYLTGYADDTTLQRAKATEPYGFILKPFEMRELHSTIEMALYKHAAAKKLRESEQRYRSLVEQSLQGIVIFQGMPPSIVYASSPCVTITGYTVEELLSFPPRKVVRLVHHEDRDRTLNWLRDLEAGKSVPMHDEFRITRKDGAVRWVGCFASSIEYGGKPALQCALIDITERKQAEAALRHAHDTLERRVDERTAELVESNRLLEQETIEHRRARGELAQRAEELRALNGLSHRVSASLSPEDVVEAALRGMVDIVAPDLAMLFLRQGDELLLQGVHPENPEWQTAAPEIHRIGQCLCGLAASEGRSAYSSAICTDPRCTLEECKKIGMNSFGAIPLLRGAEVIGVLGVASEVEREFSEQAAFLEALASAVAIGLQNALLYQELQRYAAGLERQIAERKRAEEALRESEQRYRLLFERNLAGVYRTTPDGQFLDCNQAFAEIFGYGSCEEAISCPISAFYFDPADRERFMSQLREQGRLTNAEWRLRRKDGSPVWVLENASLIIGKNGVPVAVEGTVIDITERKKVE